MPCYRCGVRQVDPVRGHSPWQRGVRGDEQVLICPDCQVTADWKSELDRCQRCGSVRLVRRLGEAECRECGFVVPPDEPGHELSPGGAAVSGTLAGAEGVASSRKGRVAHASGAGSGRAPGPGSGQAPGLAEEVAQALERVLGRPGRPPARAGLPGGGRGPEAACPDGVPVGGGIAGGCVSRR
jgi:hypothetical protein